MVVRFIRGLCWCLPVALAVATFSAVSRGYKRFDYGWLDSFISVMAMEFAVCWTIALILTVYLEVTTLKHPLRLRNIILGLLIMLVLWFLIKGILWLPTKLTEPQTLPPKTIDAY